MQLDFALLAQYADYVSDGRLAIFGAGIDGIEASSVPFQSQPMALVARFSLEPGDADHPKHYRLEITAPDGERKRMMEDQSLNILPDTNGMPPIASNLVVNLHLQFKSVGEYMLHLMLDGREVKAFPLKISRVPSLTAQAEEAEEVANG